MATGRRWRLLPWLRRWRTSLWCGACLVLLGLLALRDALPHYIMPDVTENSRVCVPTTSEMDSCMSWRPLVVRHPTCGCPRPVHALHDTCVEVEAHDAASYLTYTSTFHGNSTCSAAATLRGPNQLVLATSAVIDSPSQAQLLETAARQAQDLYRGWTFRLYTSTSSSDLNLVCPVVCNYPNVDLCGVEKAGVIDLAASEPWAWKWAVMGDPLVSVWETRRLDEALQVRDAHATTQFANAPQCWHVMRDHQGHKRTVGSGMVGGKGSWGLDEAARLRHRLLRDAAAKKDEKEHPGTSDSKNKESNDVEAVLGEHLESADTMMHDSVACTSSGAAAAVPFPSVRPPGTWVGMPQSLAEEEMDSASPTSPSVGRPGRHDFRISLNHLDPSLGLDNQARNKDDEGQGPGDTFTKDMKVNHVRDNLDLSPLFRSLGMKGWKDSESQKNGTWKTGDPSSLNKGKGTPVTENTKTNLEKTVKSEFIHNRRNSVDQTVIQVPINMSKPSGNHVYDSKMNSSTTGSLGVAPQPSEHLKENKPSQKPKDSSVLINDRRDSKAFNITHAKQKSDLKSYSTLSNAINITKPRPVPKDGSSPSKLNKLTGGRNDTIKYRIKEDAHDKPKVVPKISDNLMKRPSIVGDTHDPEVNQALKKRPKSRRSADDSKQEFKSIHDLHRELGIPPCPEACRPFLHPDWEYC